MLPFLHHLERHGLLKVAVRPFAPYLQSILTQNAHQAHKLTFISAQPIRFWSPKTPGVSRSESTFLPRGAWDSHVHVVDEVSTAIQEIVLSDERCFRKLSPSHSGIPSGRRKHLFKTY